jgi:uncharacterized protein YbaP (TraB family)
MTKISFVLRHPVVFFALLLYVHLSFGKAIAQSQPSIENSPSLFWEISGKKLGQPSYLFGTIHLIGKSDFVVDNLINEKFAAAERLILEIKIDAPDLQVKMMQFMAMRGDTTLQTLLQEEYDYVSRFMKDSLGINLMMFNSIKPLFVETLVLPQMLGEPAESYEFYFMKLAQERQKEILGLETVEEQMKLFDHIPLKEQADMLVELAKDYGAQKDLFRKLISLYKQQAIDSLRFYMLKQPEYVKYEEILLTRRNRKWVPVIKNYIQQGPVFIAVGAGHLPGEQGLLSLLKEEGYTVKPLH